MKAMSSDNFYLTVRDFTSSMADQQLAENMELLSTLTTEN